MTPPDEPKRRPPPVVTVTRTDGTPVEAWAVDPPAVPPERRAPRRRALLAAVAVTLAAGGGLAVRAEREAQGRVELALLPTGGAQAQGVGRPADRAARVRWTAEVRNDGPRAVTVVGAALGALRAGSTPVELAPGARGTLLLQGLVACVEPSPEPAAVSLVVDVTTEGGPRSVSLPVLPTVRAELDRAAAVSCGVVPLDEALAVRAGSTAFRDGTVVVRVQAANVSPDPLRLTRALVQQGLQVRALDLEGRALELPLDLPATAPGGRPAVVGFRLEVSIARCGAPAEDLSVDGAPVDSRPVDTVPVDTVGVEVDDGAGRTAGPVLLDLDARQLRLLVSEAC